MHDPARPQLKPDHLTPSPLLSRLQRARIAGIEPAPALGEEIQGAPGHRLREIHAKAPGRAGTQATDDLVAPEIDYRLVLRCSAADLDH